MSIFGPLIWNRLDFPRQWPLYVRRVVYFCPTFILPQFLHIVNENWVLYLTKRKKDGKIISKTAGAVTSGGR
jgi:hypothetical protein